MVPTNKFAFTVIFTQLAAHPDNPIFTIFFIFWIPRSTEEERKLLSQLPTLFSTILKHSPIIIVFFKHSPTYSFPHASRAFVKLTKLVA